MNLEEKTPRQNVDFRLEQMDDEQLLYNPLQTKTIYLNSSAALIWGLCDGNNNIGEIISLLKDSFPEAGDQIKSDVLNSIDELVRNQAIFLG